MSSPLIEFDTRLLKVAQIGLRVRRIEEAISRKYKEGKMRCPVHLSIGQEIPAALIGTLRSREDMFVSSHRAHAHYLSVGGDLKAMMAEIYGKITGCSKGHGGSMHLFDKNAGFLGSSAIVGNSIPVGVGIALSNKLRGDLGLTFVFFGDGATEEGVFFESLNFAALWKLPVVFVCENNKYSVYTPLTSRQPISRDVTKLADSLGIVSIKVSDRNVAFALKKIAIELQKSRVIPQPLLIEIDTYRFLEHCGPNDDDHLGYRPKSEIENFKDHDPLMSLIAELIRASHLAVEDLEALEIVFSTEITEAFHFAEQSPFPTIESVLEIP